MTAGGGTQRDEPWDVVVIGGGVAGATAAHGAAQRGHRVLLVDKAAFPRDKPCGCCLNRRAIAALRHAGLAPALEPLQGSPLDTLELHAAGRTARLPLRGSLAISRHALDNALLNAAARAGVTIRTQTTATVGPIVGDTRRVGLAASTTAPAEALDARLVLCADGLGGRSLRDLPHTRPAVRRASRVGVAARLPTDTPGYPAGRIHMAVGPHRPGGYVGLVRVEDHTLDVAAALDPAFVTRQGGPAPAIAALLDANALPVPDTLHAARWRGTAPLTQRRPRAALERLLLLGDTAGYVEPFTGEGMAWAVVGANAAVDLLDTAPTDALPRAWSKTHRRLVARRQLACRAVAATLRRPRLAAAATALLARRPATAAPLLRHMTSPAEAS